MQLKALQDKVIIKGINSSKDKKYISKDKS